MADYTENYVEHTLKKLKSIIIEKKVTNIDMFMKTDINQDFMLDKAEFGTLLKQIDMTLTAYEIELAFKKFDTNNAGSIDYSEFSNKLFSIDVSAQAKYPSPAQIKEEQAQVSNKKIDEYKEVTPPAKQQTYAEVAILKLKDAISFYKINIVDLFEKYDTTSDKNIDINEFGKLIQVIEPYIPLMDILASFAQFDKDKNYTITLQEFQAALSS